MIQKSFKYACFVGLVKGLVTTLLTKSEILPDSQRQTVICMIKNQKWI